MSVSISGSRGAQGNVLATVGVCCELSHDNERPNRVKHLEPQSRKGPLTRASEKPPRIAALHRPDAASTLSCFLCGRSTWKPDNSNPTLAGCAGRVVGWYPCISFASPEKCRESMGRNTQGNMTKLRLDWLSGEAGKLLFQPIRRVRRFGCRAGDLQADPWY